MSTPMDWQPSKAIQAKVGANKIKKKLFPGGSKTREGDPGKNGMMNEKRDNKKTSMQKHWPQMRWLKHLRDCSNKQQHYSAASYLQQWFRCIFKRLHPQKRNSCKHVRARATTCPIFQCFVCRCEIMSTNCQSSCISKHSYMHNHAS